MEDVLVSLLDVVETKVTLLVSVETAILVEIVVDALDASPKLLVLAAA